MSEYVYEARESRDQPRYPHMEQQCFACLKWTYRMWRRDPVQMCFWCELEDIREKMFPEQAAAIEEAIKGLLDESP